MAFFRPGIEERALNPEQPPDETVSAVPRLGETHRALNDRVRDELRALIVSGEFKPGDRLVEERLARRFGVSRNPVREALKSLDIEGFVELVPRRGAFVAALARDELREVIELRSVLEGLCARLAARRLDPAVRERLPRILERGEAAAAAGDLEQLKALNDTFHDALAEASANRYLKDFIRGLRGKTHWMFAGIAAGRAVESWREHAAIMRAVLERDAEVAELLASRHVDNVGRDLLDQALGDRNPGEDNAAAPADAKR